MSQRNLYLHLKEHRLIISEESYKDTNLFWFTDNEYLQMNHTQRSSIRYQLSSAGFKQKAEQLKELQNLKKAA